MSSVTWQRALESGLRWGLWLILFLAPIKWGLPILEPDKNPLPLSLAEWLLSSWPSQMFCFAVIFLFYLQCLIFLLRGTVPQMRPQWVALGPVAFFAAAVLSGLFSVHASLSSSHCFVTCAYVMLFFLLLWSSAEHLFFAGAVIASAAVVVAMGIFQHFAGFDQTAQWAGMYLSGHPQLELLQAKLRAGRVFSTFVYPNSLAGYLVMVLPLLAILAMRKAAAAGVIAAALAIGALYALFLSGSQGAWLVVALVIAAVAGKALWRVRRGPLTLLLVAGVCAAIVAAAPSCIADAIKWDTLLMRWTYWVAAWKMAMSKWWLGYGAGSFGVVYPRFMLDWGGQTQLAHSHALQVFAGMGLMGLMAWGFWWLGWLLLPRAGNDKNPALYWAALLGVVAVLLHGAMDFDMDVPGIVTQAIFFVAVLWAARCNVEAKVLSAGFAGRWMIGGVLGICLVLMPYGIFYRQALAQGCFHRAMALAGQNDWSGARGAFEEAVSYAPREPAYHFYRALALEKIGEVDAAFDAYSAASACAPTVSYYYYRAAAVIAAKSRLLAILAMRKAAAHYPGNLEYTLVLKRLQDEIQRR